MRKKEVVEHLNSSGKNAELIGGVVMLITDKKGREIDAEYASIIRELKNIGYRGSFGVINSEMRKKIGVI